MPTNSEQEEKCNEQTCVSFCMCCESNNNNWYGVNNCHNHFIIRRFTVKYECFWFGLTQSWCNVIKCEKKKGNVTI